MNEHQELKIPAALLSNVELIQLINSARRVRDRLPPDQSTAAYSLFAMAAQRELKRRLQGHSAAIMKNYRGASKK